MKAMYEKIEEQLKAMNPVVLLSLYKSSGSTPRKAGAKMACFTDGSTFGTIGGGAVEYECIKLIKEVQTADFPFAKHFTLTNADAEKEGMVCGGKMSIYFQYLDASIDTISLFSKLNQALKNNEKAWIKTYLDSGKIEMVSEKTTNIPFENLPLAPTLSESEKLFLEPVSNGSTVYIFGGGHVSQALCKMLSLTDFSAVIYENNERFCDKSLFPDAQKIIFGDFLKINENINITENDYCVVLTRGHKSDNEVVSQILSKHPSYLGVIGSKKKVFLMREYLKSRGFLDNEILKIHSPIGLSIGAQTPSEIAVSITAQLISHRNLNIKQQKS